MYPSILIVYNPVSTGGKAKTKATRLTRQLKRRGVKNVRLRKTDYPGHSEIIAYEETIRYKTPLIISVSGDGGYNGIINGAQQARADDPSCDPVCTILAAGNANDHSKAVAKQRLLRAILTSKPERVDVLKLHYGNRQRFAHSYIGLGVSAQTAAALEGQKLTRRKEAKIVTRNLLNFQHFTMKVDGRYREIDSIVCANINRMAKVLRFGEKTNLHSGLFNLILIPHRTRWKFLYLLAKIAVFGVKSPPQLDRFEFQLVKAQLVQLDGEPFALPPRITITITLEPNSILTIR